MKWWLRATALAACTLIVFGGLFAWRAHKQKVAELGQLSELRARAERGDAAAQGKLANRYFDGKGVPKDYNEALQWFQKSADQGDTRAETALGYMYFYGKGVPRDDVQAFAWYHKAAEQGYPLAQQALGWMYFNGRGAPKNYTQAAAWYQKAADQGDAVSQAALGYMNAYGLGVERDGIGSLRWYRMAAAQGEPSAVRYLKSFRPATSTRYLELGMAVIGFLAGMVFALASWDLVLPGRKLRDWRQPFIGLLGAVFLGGASLDLYASFHVIRYLPFHHAFHLVRRVLLAIGVLIFVTVLLPGKKRTAQSDPAAAEPT